MEHEQPLPDPEAEARRRRFFWDHGWTATYMPEAEPGRRWIADRHRLLTQAERGQGMVVEVYADTVDELDAAITYERAKQQNPHRQGGHHSPPAEPADSPHAEPGS
ncbi:hypothetical protein [Nocardiopsis coralliicola]